MSGAKPLVQIRNGIIWERNVLLFGIQRESGTAVVEADFSRRYVSFEVNRLFVNTGVRGLLEGKEYEAVDMMLPFVARFEDGALDTGSLLQ